MKEFIFNNVLCLHSVTLLINKLLRRYFQRLAKIVKNSYFAKGAFGGCFCYYIKMTGTMNAVLNLVLLNDSDLRKIYLHENSNKTVFIYRSSTYLFLPFYNFKQIQNKNTLPKLSDTQMLQYFIPLRMMCSEVHNFQSNKLLAVFYIGGNGITSARIA